MTKIVDVRTGRVEEYAYVGPRRDPNFVRPVACQAEALAKDGFPAENRTHRNIGIGFNYYFGALHPWGKLVIFDPDKEPEADRLRDHITRLKGELAETELQLYRHYGAAAESR